MKRSEINRAIEWAEKLLAAHGVRLPRYAYWDMDKWAENKDQIETIRQVMLGWNVEDFGRNFDARGAVTYTVRNGCAGAGVPYCERYILMKEGQQTPARFHKARSADIANRAGGVLAMRLWNLDARNERLDSDVRVRMDGVECCFRAGEEILVYPGDSVSLPPRLAYSFGPKPGYGPVIAGEISQPGEDDGFLEPVVRRAEIEEDEAVLRPLCDEYAKLI